MAAAFEHDHVAWAELGQPGLDAGVVGARRHPPTLDTGGQLAIRPDVAVRAFGVGPHLGELRLSAIDARFELHDVAIGLILGEREVEQMAGAVGRVRAHEVGRHVVCRAERARELEAARHGQRGHLLEGDERTPQANGITQVVDASPPGPARELVVRRRGEELVVVTGELGELLDDHRPGRHVDADSEGLGGEDDLHQPFGEAGLDRLLERWHHAGVVGGDARFEPGQEAAVPEHGEVAVVHAIEPGGDELADAVALGARGQAHAGIDERLRGVVATVAREQEVDRREHPLGLQAVDDLDAPRRHELAAGAVAGTGPGDAGGLGVEPARLGVRPTVDDGREQVHAVRGLVADHVQVLQPYGPVVLDHGRGRPPHGGHPLGHLVGVRHGGREAHEPYR